MTKYSDLAARADKEKTARRLTPEYVTFEKEGEKIIGAFVSKSEVSTEGGGKPYNQYLFETDDGLIKFHMGSAADTEFADQFITGNVYLVKFGGKESIKGGRTVNKFDVFEVGNRTEVDGLPSKPQSRGAANDQK